METDSFIGCIVISKFQYYDARKNEMAFKKRPFLVIKAEYETTPSDFTVLPVSKISRSENTHPDYDYFIEVSKFPKTLLKFDSYIRTHKIASINGFDFSYRSLSSFKIDYNENYNEVIDLVKQFIAEL